MLWQPTAVDVMLNTNNAIVHYSGGCNGEHNAVANQSGGFGIKHEK
jgi:hypothetical protein